MMAMKLLFTIVLLSLGARQLPSADVLVPWAGLAALPRLIVLARRYSRFRWTLLFLAALWHVAAVAGVAAVLWRGRDVELLWRASPWVAPFLAAGIATLGARTLARFLGTPLARRGA